MFEKSARHLPSRALRLGDGSIAGQHPPCLAGGAPAAVQALPEMPSRIRQTAATYDKLADCDAGLAVRRDVMSIAAASIIAK